MHELAQILSSVPRVWCCDPGALCMTFAAEEGGWGSCIVTAAVASLSQLVLYV